MKNCTCIVSSYKIILSLTSLSIKMISLTFPAIPLAVPLLVITMRLGIASYISTLIPFQKHVVHVPYAPLLLKRLDFILFSFESARPETLLSPVQSTCETFNGKGPHSVLKVPSMQCRASCPNHSPRPIPWFLLLWCSQDLKGMAHIWILAQCNTFEAQQLFKIM